MNVMFGILCIMVSWSVGYKYICGESLRDKNDKIIVYICIINDLNSNTIQIMWEKLRLCTSYVQLNGYLCWENKEEGIKGI